MLHQMSRQLPLRLLAAVAGTVDMDTVDVLPVDESLVRHDLHQLESRRVLRCLVLLQFVVNRAHRCRAAIPENIQDAEFGIGRSRSLFFGCHDCYGGFYYEGLRRVNLNDGDNATPLLEQEGTASLASRGGRQVQEENWFGT